jgi:hypothetical protein
MVDGDGDEEWKICLGDFDGKVAGVWSVGCLLCLCRASGMSSHLGTSITASPECVIFCADDNQVAVEVTGKSYQDGW